jgi:cell division protein FtsX
LRVAGFTQAEIEAILVAIKSSLTQGAQSVRFPDGSEVTYSSREKLLEEYKFWVGLLNTQDPSAMPSSFLVRTSKGVC